MDIKNVIKVHGYTLIDVAEKMGITKGAISQIVNGSPNVKTLRTIAEIVGCNIADFFADEMAEPTEAVPSFKCPYCGEELRLTVERH